MPFGAFGRNMSDRSIDHIRPTDEQIDVMIVCRSEMSVRTFGHKMSDRSSDPWLAGISDLRSLVVLSYVK